MAQIISRGKKRIITNDGTLQLNMNDNRMLMYDGQKYRFVTGDKGNGDKRTLLSKEGQNVLDVTS